MSQDNVLKDLVRHASEGNPAKVKEILSPLMADKVTDHLATKKIEVARDFIGSLEKEKGVLEDDTTGEE
jgi:hypothetical protein